MENAFSINNATHSVLLSLNPFADSKKKKKVERKKKILCCAFIQIPDTSGESTIYQPVTEGRFEI